MISHIDWLSFTFPSGVGEGVRAHHLQKHIDAALAALPDVVGDLVTGGQTFEQRSGRAPYSVGWQRADGGVTIFAHPALPHALVEISGKGCEVLGSSPVASDFLAAVALMLTRLDVACDMLTDTSPDVFAQQRAAGRFKAWGEVVSQSGHTVYVGSRQSDRYARVYRYTAPHPRAHLLRSEFVLKKEQARLAAAQLLELGIDKYAAQLGNTFGWSHEDWKPDVQTPAEAAAWRPERRQGKTVRWLHAQVIPALVALHRQNVVDVRRWWSEFVLPELARIEGEHYTANDTKSQ